MKTLRAMRTGQFEKFAHFLEDHPGFSPELIGENAHVSGFHVGNCFLSVEDMESLIVTRGDVSLTAVLETAPPELSKKGLL